MVEAITRTGRRMESWLRLVEGVSLTRKKIVFTGGSYATRYQKK